MDDAALMKRALELAERGRGWVEPNPVVGAVLARGGEVVGEGWHRRFGGPHAEVEALADARARGVDPAGLTMVVTLEPCAHHGKTPPCADALVAAGVGRVVAAMVDPFGEVSGRGIERLRSAGVVVEVGVLEAEARRVNAPFVKRVTTGLPYVIAKWAQTVDGKIATATGDSRWISGEASRRRVHELRARVDAIVAGVGTVATDDPSLTARGVEVRRVARRVVVDPRLRSPEDAKLLGDGGPAVTIAHERREGDAGLARARDRLRALGAELVPLSERCGHRLDLRPLLAHLVSAHGATNVLAEGGAGLLGSLFEQDLVDELHVYVAPKLIGDREAPSAVDGLPCARVEEAKRLVLTGVERIGADVLLTYGRG